VAAGLIDDHRADHLVPGLRLPALSLPSTSGSAIDLSSRQGRTVIFCYPWTGRPGVPNPPRWDDIAGAHGSTPQAEAFRDLHPAFQARNVLVCGLSMQETDYQKELAARLALPFALLSDARRVFMRALHLPTFETGDVLYLVRLTLIIEDGVLRDRLYPVDVPEQSAVATLARLDALL
jgi:peroxiredoxin